MKHYLCKILTFFKIKCSYCNDWSKEIYDQACFDNFQKKLTEWTDLEENWDGEGAKPFSDLVLDNVEDFIKCMKQEKAPVPKIYMAGDGEIGFRWTGGIRAHISFLEDGSVVGYCQKYHNYKAVELDTTYEPLYKKLEVLQFLDKIKKLIDYWEKNQHFIKE